MGEKLRLVFILFIFLIGLVAGSFIYSFVEGWSFLDAFYFTAMTVTTVGYGDLVPVTNLGKIFTIFYSFFGIATAFYLFSKVGNMLFKRHISAKVGEVKRDVMKQEKIKQQIDKSIKKAVVQKKSKN